MTIERVETRWGHKYKIDGEDAPGVTTLISGGVPKPALMHWAARSVAEHVYHLDVDTLLEERGRAPEITVNNWKSVPFKASKKAAARGTEIHGYAERLVKGWDVDVPIHLAGYVQACVDFLNEWRPAPVLVEAVVASKEHRYCGTVDLIADLPDGRRALMDYKTSGSGVYGEAALQLAAYRWADTVVDKTGNEFPLANLGINCAYAVWLKDGAYEVRPLRTDEHVFTVFLAAADVARNTKDMQTWVGEPELWKVLTK